MSLGKRLRPLVERELAAADAAEAGGDPALAFRHLERAHVLSQASTALHVRVHWRMLRWGWRQRDGREVRGQVPRLLVAATKTFLGWVPTGNTGGANVNPIQPMPIPDDLAAMLAAAREGRDP